MYDNPLVGHFVGMIMWNGKKSIAEKIIYDSFEIIHERTKKGGLNIFEQAVKNVAEFQRALKNEDLKAGIMLLVITGVGFLIHVYSVGYMHGEDGFTRFFTYMNLFMVSMLLLVMGNNYVVLFIGWEGVGLCSYLLIGYYYDKVSAAKAASKVQPCF